MHGAYNSRVAARTFSDRVTLGQATNIYLQDLKQNPYIFIDDFMVSIDTVIYYAKQLNLTLKQGKVNLNFNISSDNYVSFELKLNINLYQGDKPFFTLDTDFEVQNIAYVISYYVSDPIPPIISAFSR
ncbi:MAG: hypothetical protein MJ233_03560 [Mycoplasmoidaceae bacterium]|nr:hypothetical protein [Mycoplasmoidaceae bacterium]